MVTWIFISGGYFHDQTPHTYTRIHTRTRKRAHMHAHFSRDSLVRSVSYHTTLNHPGFSALTQPNSTHPETKPNSLPPPRNWCPCRRASILCLSYARPLLTPAAPRTRVMYSGIRMSYKLLPLPPTRTRMCVGACVRVCMCMLYLWPQYLLTAFWPLPECQWKNVALTRRERVLPDGMLEKYAIL